MHAKMTIRLRSHTTIRKRVLGFSLFECGARIRGAKAEVGIHYLQEHREARKQKSPPAITAV